MMLKLSKSISFLFLALAVLVLAACAPQGQLPGTGGDDQVIETPAGSPQLPPKAVLDAQSWLAGRLNVSPQQIEIGEVEQAEWTDACLGLGQADESCAAVMTRGWRAVFTVDGETYEVRTDETGSNIRSADVQMEGPGTPGAGDEVPPAAVLDAQSWLAEQLNVSTGDVEITEVEQAEWTDSCLGLGQAHESCAAVITPGWRAIFTVNVETYEVRTDETGSAIRSEDFPAEIPGAPDAETGLEGRQWNLVSMGPEGSETPVVEGSMVTLTLDEGQAGGSGGCNSYGSAYQLRGDELVFERVTSTLMACAEEAVTQQESAYFQALETASEYEVQDDRLMITYEGGVLTFEAATPEG